MHFGRKEMKMILADKIINERKKNGWSQEELADMLGVSRQSVSKWEGAQSVPDLQKILKLAELFGVSTDYLLKDELEPEGNASNYMERSDIERNVTKVSLEDANEYIELRKALLPKIGIGVFLCITCPVLLIFLAGLSETGKFGINEKTAVALGLIALFAHIGVAVYLFISNSGKLSKYEFLEKEDFETEYGVDGMARARLEESEMTNSRALVTGVLLCVLGVVPLIICSVMELPQIIIISTVCLLLFAVACGVYMFVAICGVTTSYKILLQMDDYTSRAKRTNDRLEPLTRAYWLLITAVYLAVSFLTMRWDRTWIIWAVSGVFFALVRAIATTLVGDK